MLNKKGSTLIELLIVAVIGVFILEAAYLLYSGSLKLFTDVRTRSSNIQTKVPSVEMIGRYFDRWGANVLPTGSDCTNYPPSSAKCLTKTAQTGLASGVACDEVTFWGNLYGTGFVKDVSANTAHLLSCRLSSDNTSNCYYLWRSGAINNDAVGNSIIPLSFNGSLSPNLTPNNADCSALASDATANATVYPQLKPSSGATSNKTLQAGDVLLRAPHKVRLYCAANANDANRNWLYADLTDTATDCGSNEAASPIAPVDSFQVAVLSDPSGNNTAAEVTVVFRSQSQKYSRTYDRQTVKKVFGR
jgi:hypothetical protein